MNYRNAKDLLDASHKTASPEKESAYRFLKDVARSCINLGIRNGASHVDASNAVWDMLLTPGSDTNGMIAQILELTRAYYSYVDAQEHASVWRTAKEASHEC